MHARVEITVGHRTFSEQFHVLSEQFHVLSEQFHVLSEQFRPYADNLSEQFISNAWSLHYWDCTVLIKPQLAIH